MKKKKKNTHRLTSSACTVRSGTLAPLDASPNNLAVNVFRLVLVDVASATSTVRYLNSHDCDLISVIEEEVEEEGKPAVSMDVCDGAKDKLFKGAGTRNFKSPPTCWTLDAFIPAPHRHKHHYSQRQ